MKKFYYLMLAALAVLCVSSSCSKSDDGASGEEGAENVTANSIVGTWECVTIEGWESWDGGKEEWKEDVNRETESWTYTFNANGTGVSSTYYQGEKISDETFKWSLSGNKLTIVWYDDYDSETDIYTVESLSSNQLVISISGQYEDEKWYDKETCVRVK